MYKSFLLSLVIGGLCLPAPAAVIYNETVSGSLSNNGLAPTEVSVSPGSNQILGTNGSGASSTRDYVTFTIPAGYYLTSLTLLDTALGTKGFIGLEAGNQLTLPPNTMTAAGLLGWWHYVPADAGSDLLPLMSIPAQGSSGFTAPLPAGDYTLWIQDSSAGTFDYGFDLQIAVPEPGTWVTPLAGAALLLLRRRRPR